MKKKRNYFRLFTDILKENGKYSQGRVYLLWSVFAYYITLIILTYAGIKGVSKEGTPTIDIENFKIIIDALEFAMSLFGGYVFGGKFITAYRAIKGVDSESKSEADSELG